VRLWATLRRVRPDSTGAHQRRLTTNILQRAVWASHGSVNTARGPGRGGWLIEANCKLLLTVVGMAALLAMPDAVLAQTQFGGVVTLKLSDPGGKSEPWRVQRQLLRSWPRMESCESQKMSFRGFHIGRVEGIGLITPSGTSPIVEVETVECMTIRELRSGRNLSPASD
jgi:hypothetical protein